MQIIESFEALELGLSWQEVKTALKAFFRVFADPNVEFSWLGFEHFIHCPESQLVRAQDKRYAR